jgi:serine/threonine protein kinase/DNA-binding SARP family transcriptional activator
VNQSADGAGSTLPASEELLVNQLCDEFEDAWKSGRQPRLEDYLNRAPAPGRTLLLRELLCLDYHYHCRLNRTFPLEAYKERFPELDVGWLVEPTAAPEELAERPMCPSLGTPSQGTGDSSSDSSLRHIGRRLGDYELLAEIAHGGMGIVYRARQISLNRIVAVKLIRSGELASEKEFHRFQVEAEAAASLDHPNIVPVYEIGSEEGFRYLAMKLVEGRNLGDRLDEFGLTASPPDAAAGESGRSSAAESEQRQREIARLMTTIARAVHYAHQRGILHRDLKPSNILLDAVNTPFVSDFGLAKRVGPASEGGPAELTGTGMILGTPSYMAPEQARSDKALTTAVDVYALGGILYHLLTKTPPFGGPTPFDVVQRLLNEEPTPPHKLQPRVAVDLETICLKCLQKDPAARYASAEELAHDLERFEHGEPIQARPVSNWKRAWMWCRRNRVVAGSVAAVALTLVGGAGVSTWQAVRATQAQAVAVRERDDKDIARQAEAAARTAEKARADEAKRHLETLFGLVSDIDYRKIREENKPLEREFATRLVEMARQLEAGPVSDPLETAALQDQIGHTLLSLGEYESAQQLFRAARARYLTQLGADHPFTLTTLNNLARAYQAAGELPQAIELYEEVRDAKVKQLGADHLSTLTTLSNLAGAYLEHGKVAQAIALFEQVRDDKLKKLGADHPDTLITLNDLALAYRFAGQLPQAVALYEQVYDASVKNLGADHPDTLTTLSGLASAYQAADKLPQAIELFEQLREAQVKMLGADHPNSLSTLNGLAMAYQHTGRLPQAIALYEQVHNASVKKLGANHPYTFTARNNLATAYQAADKLPQAIELFEQVRDAQVKQLGADHPSTLVTLNNLARAYQVAGNLTQAIELFEQAATGIEQRRFLHEGTGRIISNTVAAYETAQQYDKAEAWQRKGLAIVKTQSGTDSPGYATELTVMGSILLQQQKWTDAETTIRECLAIRETKEPDDWRTYYLQSMLGGALLGQKKYADAEPLLLKGHEGMKQRADKIPPVALARIPESLKRLVQLYEETGKKEEAAKWRKELAAWFGNQLQRNHAWPLLWGWPRW